MYGKKEIAMPPAKVEQFLDSDNSVKLTSTIMTARAVSAVVDFFFSHPYQWTFR